MIIVKAVVPILISMFSPTLVANLWDVTDKDIDKLCQAVLNKMSLNGPDIENQSVKGAKQLTSLVSAVAQSRDCCKLKYLTGAAPVVYGIPFYA
jgi:separase